MPKDPSLRLPPPPVPLPPPCSSYSFSSFAPVSFPLEPFDRNKSYTTYKKKRNADELADDTTYFPAATKPPFQQHPTPDHHSMSEKPFPLILFLRQLLFLHPLHASATPSEFSSFVFFCFFSPPFPCFAFSLPAKTRAFSHERSFPFPGPHARTLSSQMGQCARKATGRAHHCARARVLFANGECSGRERWESVSFFFFPTCFTTQSCSLIFLTATRLFTAHF